MKKVNIFKILCIILILDCLMMSNFILSHAEDRFQEEKTDFRFEWIYVQYNDAPNFPPRCEIIQDKKTGIKYLLINGRFVEKLEKEDNYDLKDLRDDLFEHFDSRK